MKVLTFGWDYPPVRNGGLGVACMGLTTELTRLGVEVIFVLPRAQEVESNIRFIFGGITRAQMREVSSPLLPYVSSRTMLVGYSPDGKMRMYSHSLIDEVYRYAREAARIAAEEVFDVVHAHDWTSYLAGLAAKEMSGKPCVLHVHATSFDQAGGDNVDPEIYAIESRAFRDADGIIAVSNYTKQLIVQKHGVDPEKISVVYNGAECFDPDHLPPILEEWKREGKKIILFHGRITLQKGPDYFVRAARRVIDADQNVMFIISGWGDMEHELMQLVGSLGLSSHVKFVGALWGKERDQMYQNVDLFVMPSVSEPFGLVALEALAHGAPVLISKQSGVSEVLAHALKVDFWDIEDMANKMLAVSRYDSLRHQLRTYGKEEIKGLTWSRAAQKVREIYHTILEKLRLRSTDSKTDT